MLKSTVEEIKQRFDNDVKRFSNLDTGQVSTIDAQISLELEILHKNMCFGAFGGIK
jgi:tRNA (cmo5U34)-methyltransferase